MIRGKAYIKNTWMRTNILVSDNGYIVKLYRSKYTNRFFMSKVDVVYDAKDSLILPGIIDIHTHMREPGYEYKEDFDTGTKAALASGITVIGDMPNNRPIIKDYESLKMKIELATKKSWTDFFLYLYLTNNEKLVGVPNDLSNSLRYIKVFLYDERHFDIITKDQKKLPRTPLYVFHAEHPAYIKSSLPRDAIDHNNIRSPKAEIEGVKLALSLAERGYRIHITHVTVPTALRLIRGAKKRGLKVSCDVTPHHLIFYLEKIDVNDPVFKVNPPIRPKILRDSLIKFLYANEIDIIATDHAPHAIEDKKDFPSAASGVASIQYFLPLVYSLSRKIHINFNKILPLLSENPARIFGIKKRGAIKVGNYADLVIFNHRRRWIVDPDYSLSKSRNTPYNKMLIRGYVEAVFLRGNLVYQKGLFLKRLGKYILLQ